MEPIRERTLRIKGVENMISVIIPCYNAATTVKETLESLDNQTYKNFEVICVDDGSNDTTCKIIENFKQNHRIDLLLIRQKNAGVSVARNTGIEHSKGEILLFLDADDMYRSNFLEEVAKGHDEGYDVVFGTKTEKQDQLEAAYELDSKSRTRNELMDAFMYNKGRYTFSLFSYKKKLIDRYNIRFTPGARYGEDWEFATKCLDCCKSGKELLYPIMFHRIIETSAMHKIVYNHVDAISSAERTESWLKSHGSDYYGKFSHYMKHRAVLSVAHKFAKNRAKEYYRRFVSEYDVKSSMKALIMNKQVDINARIAAASFLVSENLFYYFIGRI